MSVDFDFSQVTKLAHDVGQAAVKVKALNESRVLDQTAREARAEMITRAPRLTGALAASIDILDSGPGFRTVGSPLKQGFFQEFGTSRHPPQSWAMPAGDKAGDAMAERLGDIADKVP